MTQCYALCVSQSWKYFLSPTVERNQTEGMGWGRGWEGCGRGCGAGGWSQVANNGPVLKNVTFENGERHTHWVSPAEAEWRNLGGAAESAGIPPPSPRSPLPVPPAKNND